MSLDKIYTWLQIIWVILIYDEHNSYIGVADPAGFYIRIRIQPLGGKNHGSDLGKATRIPIQTNFDIIIRLLLLTTKKSIWYGRNCFENKIWIRPHFGNRIRIRPKQPDPDPQLQLSLYQNVFKSLIWKGIYEILYVQTGSVSDHILKTGFGSVKVLKIGNRSNHGSYITLHSVIVFIGNVVYIF